MGGEGGYEAAFGMIELKKCPCGKTPKSIGSYQSGGGYKWAFAHPSCCGEWNIEYRTQYSSGEELLELAVEAWNNAPRGFT